MSHTLGKSYRFCVLSTFVAFTVGCDSSDPGASPANLRTVPTSGKVTYNGNPVEKGKVTFVPAGPNDGRGEQAEISAGTYQTAEGRGLVVGNYLVIVQVPPVEAAEPEDDGKKVEPPPGIPGKYADPRTTDLVLKVTEADQTLVKDFELKD